ncbi:hypothetical protein H0H93_012377 [Arthromyces matolae]|nr:hypothetical protein H0H93_012377 [Arthromyces matolae]
MDVFHNLIPSIYHEKQQPGSMLCAQHALNNLLHIAHNLDALEHTYDDAHSGSTNMDDTGFFSIQVLENALSVWGLSLTRWRGEDMRPYQNHPHTQLAFILNLEQHWYTLRRFGHAESNMNDDIGDGHWFNLNSFLPEPQWVGKLYLTMVLQQAEAEGYSVFAVTQVDPSAPLALPRTAADEIASTLPEPSSSGRSASANISHPSDGLEDEDYELQAILHESLMNNHTTGGSVHQAPPPLARSFMSLPPDDSINHPELPVLTAAEDEEDDEAGSQVEGDPVAASMARSQLMLQRMRAHQELAQRELWEDGSMNEEDAAVVEARRQRQQRAEEEEAEQLRVAIAESEKLANDHRDDAIVDLTRPESTSSLDNDTFVGQGSNRVYDDDDLELQAALKASLEHVPDGWEFPELPVQPAPSRPAPMLASSVRIPPQSTDQQDMAENTDDEDSARSEESKKIDESGTVSVDELRKRRLARFGL